MSRTAPRETWGLAFVPAAVLAAFLLLFPGCTSSPEPADGGDEPAVTSGDEAEESSEEDGPTIYECAECGATADRPLEHHGQPMEPVEGN